MRIKRLAAAAIAAIITVTSSASAEGVLYFGVGQKETGDPMISDKMPWSIGYINQKNDSTIWGIDIAGEGTMLDSTWGQNSKVSQALSYNLIYGTNISQSATSRFDIGALIGIRETFSDCANSFLGFQCYANTSPETDYALNYGVILSYSFSSTMVGLRATGESVQLIVGAKF